MNKNVLITGGSGGIGSATARLFAKNGYNVGIVYHKNEKAAELLRDEILAMAVDCEIFQCDISSREEVERLFGAFHERIGKVDVLINNAGVAQQKLFMDITLWEWNRIFDINVTGVFNMCQCALADMIDAKCGSIVNVSSMWGIAGASCEAHYSATKAAVISLTKSLAKEYGPSNIRVNCVAPGVIDTRMNAHLDQIAMAELKDETVLGRIGTPLEAAEAIYFLASEKASFITGQTLTCDGGFI
ncbi:MAG: 3-oxoacyl-ACP reductase FabG [Clostridia bacterium]|nr:3-oxoacyl-ACP reductase FabG [Clostridia bacterium]